MGQGPLSDLPPAQASQRCRIAPQRDMPARFFLPGAAGSASNSRASKSCLVRREDRRVGSSRPGLPSELRGSPALHCRAKRCRGKEPQGLPARPRSKEQDLPPTLTRLRGPEERCGLVAPLDPRSRVNRYCGGGGTRRANEEPAGEERRWKGRCPPDTEGSAGIGAALYRTA